jgi:plastocyanin
MKNVSKYFWLMFGLILIGGGCSSPEEATLPADDGAGVEVVEVEGEDDSGGVEVTEEDDGTGISAPDVDTGSDDIADALQGSDEEPIGGDPVVDANFTVTSGNFFFEPSSMRVNAGDTVNLFFAENSGTHDFTIDEIEFSQKVVDGGSMTFTAPSTPGSYAYYCSIGSHRALGMEGVLIVE